MEIKLSDHFNYGRLFRFVISPILMMVFISIYGVVDGFFVSNFVGKSAFASLNLVMPFIMILSGMGFMVGSGGTALVAKYFGEKEDKYANQIFTMMVIFTTILGITVSVLGITFIRPVCYLLGATDDMIDNCMLYGRTLLCFTPLFMLQNVFQSFLTVAEKPKLGLYVTLAAGITNMIMDPVLIAGFHMGLRGAAIATGLGEMVGSIIPFIYFLRPNSSILRLTKTKLELKPILKACGNGSSELMSNISGSIVGMIYNWQLMKYLGEDGVSAYGVIMYVGFIFVAIGIGYSIGISPIVGYNFGSKNTIELKNIFKKSVILMSISGLLMFGLSEALAVPLAKLFVGYNEDLYNLTVRAFSIYSIHFVFVCLNIFASGFFTALNNGIISAIIAFSRTLVFQCCAVILLPLIMGSDGLWAAVIVSESGAFILSLIFILAKRKKYQYF